MEQALGYRSGMQKLVPIEPSGAAVSSADVSSAAASSVAAESAVADSPASSSPDSSSSDEEEPSSSTASSTQQPMAQQPSTQQPSTQQPMAQQPSTQQPSTQQLPRQPSKLAQAAEGNYAMVAAYMARHAAAKMVHTDYCYRHHPDHSNLLPDKYTMEQMQNELDTLPKEDCKVISHMWNLFGTASGRQRQIIMKGMLSQCCFPQLSDVSSHTKELLRIDFIASLPIELSFKILGYLDANSLCMASMVSRTWKRLADDDVVWYHLCEQHIDRKCTTCGWGLPLLERKRLRRSKRAVMDRLESLTNHQEVPSNGLYSASSSSRASPVPEIMPNGKHTLDLESVPSAKRSRPTITRPWKEVYLERYKIEQNWRSGKYVVKDFQHPYPVLSLQFDEQYLIAGTCDGLVSVWDVETRKLVRQLHGHIRGVSALKFDSTKLVTGSWDQSVRVWNYRTGQCLCTFGGHESKILCIDFDSNLIAAGSEDSSIKIWDFVTKSCFTLRGHTGAVHSVRIHKASNTLFTSSEDLTVRMWCLDSKRCIRIFGGPENGPMAHVAQIQYALPITLEHLEGESQHDHHILSSGVPEILDDQPVQDPIESAVQISPFPEWSMRTRRQSNSSNNGDDDDTDKRMVLPTHLLTASLDNTIKVWDIATGRCARTLFGHIEGVWCIAADHFRIVSGAHDKLVKVWDVQSGKCWHTFSGHTKPVCCVGLTDTGFASGGDDGLVKLFSFDN